LPDLDRHLVEISINFFDLRSGANVIELYTAVIYHHCIVIPLLCVKKLYHLGDYLEIPVKYRGILTLEKKG
jgi:hypothetical protein